MAAGSLMTATLMTGSSLAPAPAVVVLFVVGVVVGVASSLAGRKLVLCIVKPLTTLLLFAVVGWPRTSVAWWVDLGLAFSVLGDVALLIESRFAFLVGLALFLGTHASYIAGFGLFALAGCGTGGGGLLPMVGAAVAMGIVTEVLLRRLWPTVAGLRAPVVIYGLALATTVVVAVAAVTVPGPTSGAHLSALAPLGAALFYAADAGLALDKFTGRIPYASLLTLGVYWLGQLLIALAARTAI